LHPFFSVALLSQRPQVFQGRCRSADDFRRRRASSREIGTFPRQPILIPGLGSSPSGHSLQPSKGNFQPAPCAPRGLRLGFRDVERRRPIWPAPRKDYVPNGHRNGAGWSSLDGHLGGRSERENDPCLEGPVGQRAVGQSRARAPARAKRPSVEGMFPGTRPDGGCQPRQSERSRSSFGQRRGRGRIWKEPEAETNPDFIPKKPISSTGGTKRLRGRCVPASSLGSRGYEIAVKAELNPRRSSRPEVSCRRLRLEPLSMPGPGEEACLAPSSIACS
jgi:hypothetical protein